nr:MAG TPA: ATP synthase B/B' [Caudoviricetes sp.]
MIILVRGLNILILCGFVYIGIMNPLKQIFKTTMLDWPLH